MDRRASTTGGRPTVSSSPCPSPLTLKDGSTVDLTGLGGSIEPETGRTVCRKGGVFEEILDLSTVESVTVAGITLPVTP